MISYLHRYWTAVSAQPTPNDIHDDGEKHIVIHIKALQPDLCQCDRS